MKESTDYIRKCTACGKVVTYGRKSKPKTCPYCHDIYWDKPKDERDLFILQDKYIELGRSNEVLGKMYLKIVKYSENIIKKDLKRSGKILQRDDLADKAESVAIKLIERYLKSPDSTVQSSFGAMLIRISKGILYSNSAKKADQEASLDMKIDENLSIMNNPSYFISDPVAKEKFEDTYELDAYDELIKESDYEVSKEMIDLIMKMCEKIRTYQNEYNSIYFLIGIKNFLDHSGKIQMNNFYDICSNQTRTNIENGKMVIRQYLIDRMRIK